MKKLTMVLLMAACGGGGGLVAGCAGPEKKARLETVAVQCVERKVTEMDDGKTDPPAIATSVGIACREEINRFLAHGARRTWHLSGNRTQRDFVLPYVLKNRGNQ